MVTWQFYGFWSLIEYKVGPYDPVLTGGEISLDYKQGEISPQGSTHENLKAISRGRLWLHLQLVGAHLVVGFWI